jgi:hypothetical protein
MHGEYAGKASDQVARDILELERIAMAAERLGAVNERLSGFLHRMRGGGPEANSGPVPVRNGYLGSIEDLFDQVDVAEKLATEICSLG